MKSHFKENGQHIFVFLPEVLKYSTFAAVKLALFNLKKNLITKSYSLILQSKKKFNEISKTNGNALQELQEVHDSVKSIQNTMQKSCKEIVKSFNSVKLKQSNFELFFEDVQLIVNNLSSFGILPPMLNKLKEIMKNVCPEVFSFAKGVFTGHRVEGLPFGRGFLKMPDNTSMEGY